MSGVDDLAVLRRYEPVIHYTRGERFFPMDVERYIQECSLWVQHPDEPAELLIPEGELTVEKLIQPRPDGFGTIHFLKFIEPLDLIELARYSFNQAMKKFSQRDTGDVFFAGRGRLARVGYGSRFVDALFSITFFMRGRVPGDTAAAAALTYKRLQQEKEQYCYYGRVVRQGGWIILQYWYFYPFNNWRSGFFGVNDHEADWEMVSIYCSQGQPESGGQNELDGPPDSCLVPQWVAYASHDFSGDDLRRRWDDPEVQKVGDHPIIFAGAGSHAAYFTPGEYLSEVELPFLKPLVRFVDTVNDFWVKKLRQTGANPTSSEFNVFRVPFVDYARGDGLTIGPGQVRQWNACLLDENTPWAVNYRGLWGLYARDPISGENAPAGPVFNRNGSVRRSWYDPLGWAGLDKIPPPDQAMDVLLHQREELGRRIISLEDEIGEKRLRLQGLGIEIAALEGLSHLEVEHDRFAAQISDLSEDLRNLGGQLAVEKAKMDAFEQFEQRLQAGDHGPMRAHIQHAQLPSSGVDLRMGRLAEIFAAVSIGLVMVGIVLLIEFARHYLIFGLAAMIGLLIFIEAGFRRRLSQLVSSLVIGLAVVSAFILIVEFFWQIVVIGVLAAGLYIMWENIREIRR